MTATERKGIHDILEQDHPYIFIDSCMQAWPDADYPNAHRLGVTVMAATAWLPHASVDAALEQLMNWHLLARQHPNLTVIETVDDIRRTKQEGKAAFLLAAQDGDWIGDRLHRIEAFYRLGLRMMLPAYNASNQICAGALDLDDSGLTRLGRVVVEECNRVGVLLDCTHLGRKSSLEIIEHSSQPVVFSHSNPNAVVQNPRNIDDEQIKACVDRGGLIGLASYGPLVMKAGTTTRPQLDDFIDMVDYVAQLTGSTDHIGIGTDMSIGTYGYKPSYGWGNPGYPNIGAEFDKHVTREHGSSFRAVEGFSQYSEVVNLIDRLQARGYSDEDVRKILGENYMRIFAQVWR